jgi:hypothetical protein
MKSLLATAIVCLLFFTAKAQYVSLNAKEVEDLKQLVNINPDVKYLYKELQQTANAALTAQPNAIDTIRTEGLLKGDPRKTVTTAALQDMHKIYSLAYVYRISGDKRYLKKASQFLAAWAAKNYSKGDPIDDTNLDAAIEGYDLIKTDLLPAENAAIKVWLSRVATAEMVSPRMQTGRTASNNWNSHRLKVVGEIAYAINDDSFKKFTIEALKVQIAKNLEADGSSIDFKLRDALHYHVYDLEPLLKLAIVIKRATGINFYSYTSAIGSSIKKSVEWVLPYLNGEKTHAEYVNSTSKFDAARANNNEPAFKTGALFKPEAGLPTLLLASYFDNAYIKNVKTIKDSPSEFSDWQLALNKAMLD